MNNRHRVSIGLPVYNGENYLKEAVDSILSQTFEDFELIISNNASADKTEEICREYAAKDKRIRYYHNEKNIGAAANYNRVFHLSTGEYFKWAAHDDLCAPEFLERCTAVLDQYPSVILCYPKTTMIEEDGKHQEYDDRFHLPFSKAYERFAYYQKMMPYVYGCHGAHPIFGLIRSNVLRRTALIGNYPSSDGILLGELTLYGQFYEVPEYLFFKREHSLTSIKFCNHNFKKIYAWYDPRTQGKLQATRLRWFREYLKGIRRAPINWNEKSRCYALMLRWIRWNWVGFVKDLIKIAAWPFVKPLLFLNSSRS